MLAKGSTTQGSPHKYQDLIRQVADSDTFRTAPTMRALLLYLWEHQGEPISEYAIATEALGRSPEFDPRLDSTVRVQAARLRAKLKEFYEAEGDDFPLRLSLPRGRHELIWAYQAPHKSLASTLRAFPKRYVWAVGVTELALVIVCAVLVIQNQSLKSSRPPAPPAVPRFWQSFLMPGKPTVIVVPSPLYFYWPAHRVYIRDLETS